MTDQPVLAALRAQAVSYLAETHNPDTDPESESESRALNVVLGEPGNHDDPRRSLVVLAFGEVWAMIANVADRHAQSREEAMAVMVARVIAGEICEGDDEDVLWSVVAEYLINVDFGLADAASSLALIGEEE